MAVKTFQRTLFQLFWNKENAYRNKNLLLIVTALHLPAFPHCRICLALDWSSWVVSFYWFIFFFFGGGRCLLEFGNFFCLNTCWILVISNLVTTICLEPRVICVQTSLLYVRDRWHDTVGVSRRWIWVFQMRECLVWVKEGCVCVLGLLLFILPCEDLSLEF